MISVSFNGNASTNAIRDAIAQIDDMTPIFRDISEYMTEATRQRFIQGKAPDGTAWAKKQSSTLERYKSLGYGNLKQPLIGPGKRLSKDVVGQATRSGAVIGSALIYSRVMQDGAEKGAFGTSHSGRFTPWGRIPARVWLGISIDDERTIVGIAEDHLSDALGHET